MGEIFDVLREAVAHHDEWPTQDTSAAVINTARSLVQAVDTRAAVIEQMRQQVTPTEQALSELIGER